MFWADLKMPIEVMPQPMRGELKNFLANKFTRKNVRMIVTLKGVPRGEVDVDGDNPGLDLVIYAFSQGWTGQVYSTVNPI